MNILKSFLLMEKKSIEKINGTTYEVVALEQILVAKKPGKIEVEPFILDTQLVCRNQRSRRRGGFFDDFFQSGRVIEKRFRSNTNKLHHQGSTARRKYERL